MDSINFLVYCQKINLRLKEIEAAYNKCKWPVKIMTETAGSYVEGIGQYRFPNSKQSNNSVSKLPGNTTDTTESIIEAQSNFKLYLQQYLTI